MTNVRLAWGMIAMTFVAVAQPPAATELLRQGKQLRAQGRYSEAQEILLAVLRDAGREQPESRFVAEVLDNLGINENNLGNYANGERDFYRAQAILHSSPADDLLANSVKTHLAELYMAEMRPSDAEPLLRQAAAGLGGAAQPNRVALAVAYNDLAVAHAMRRKYRESEALLRQGLALLETELGLEHPMLVSSLNPLAGVLVAEHRYADAVAPAERAWHIMRSTSLGIGTPDLASVLDILGQVYAHGGRLVEAQDCARQAVEMGEAVYGPRHPRLGRYLARYASVLKLADRSQQAKDVQKRADAIRDWNAHDASGSAVSVNALR